MSPAAVAEKDKLSLEETQKAATRGLVGALSIRGDLHLSDSAAGGGNWRQGCDGLHQTDGD